MDRNNAAFFPIQDVFLAQILCMLENSMMYKIHIDIEILFKYNDKMKTFTFFWRNL